MGVVRTATAALRDWPIHFGHPHTPTGSEGIPTAWLVVGAAVLVLVIVTSLLILRRYRSDRTVA